MCKIACTHTPLFRERMQLKKTEVVSIPENVSLTVDGKKVSVTGPRGDLNRDFSFAPVDLQLRGKTLDVVVWFPRAKLNAMPRTIASHIDNMIIGVTRGFRYIMKAAHSHYPMELSLK